MSLLCDYCVLYCRPVNMFVEAATTKLMTAERETAIEPESAGISGGIVMNNCYQRLYLSLTCFN